MTKVTLSSQSDWRQIKRQTRQSLSAEERNRYSQRIIALIQQLPAYQQAKHVGCYWALAEEVNVTPLIKRAWADHKSVYLPVVVKRGKPLKFATFSPSTTLTRDALGIAIPDVTTSQYIMAKELDVVITPLVAFDVNGHRIGMGGGFYDRTFAFKQTNPSSKPILIGVAFDQQCVTEGITAAPWDVSLSMIITQSQLYQMDNH